MRAVSGSRGTPLFHEELINRSRCKTTVCSPTNDYGNRFPTNAQGDAGIDIAFSLRNYISPEIVSPLRSHYFVLSYLPLCITRVCKLTVDKSTRCMRWPQHAKIRQYVSEYAATRRGASICDVRNLMHSTLFVSRANNTLSERQRDI